ncbi:ABC transporter substrate-binding protein [Bosea lathyri]|uniref:Peptide/nickel transport system substrate-binding protein n=1 Tax=Bosea lathyri TaxID=1036778 RepID=A0A1H5S1B0_9HYPH|nr:ABC transporter substrate-binding protein [Bosea lathyri]SEF44403.1 peptide/nickel transport system substrate-binding protein [Bosea lathyri]
MKRLSLAAAILACLIAPAAAQATKDVLTIDAPNDAATLDPHLQWDADSYGVYRNIFDNLVTRDASGKIVPQIATAWRTLDDTHVEFDLRTDVKFHDGTALTADDVVFSVKRITNPDLKSSQLSQFNQIVDAKAEGPGKVVLTTQSPYPVLLAQLVKLSIVPKAYVERVGDQEFNLKPVGSGPYKLREWQKGVQATVDAVDTYWRGKPPFKTVVFRAVPDVSTRIADLKTGRADLVRLLPPDEAIALKKEPALNVLTVPTERVGYMFINAQAGPTTDLKVRQAIAYAVDKQGIIDALLQGLGKPVNSIGADPIFGYQADIAGYGYDPAKAKALVKEAKAEGAELTFLTSPAYDRRIVEAIQQMVNDVGLKVNVVMLDHATFLRRRQGTPAEAGQLAIGVWSCACQDADGIIFPLFRTGSTWSKYSNPAFDTAADAARSTLDEAKRMAAYKSAYEVLRQDVPGLGLYQAFASYGARKELQWQPTSNESLFVMDMNWKR